MKISELGSLALFALLLHSNICAQNTVASGFGSLNTGAYSLSYSVGQVFFEANDALTISQGVQIPHENQMSTAIEEKYQESGFTLYPNPSDGDIFLKIDHPAGAELVLFDATGKEHMRIPAKAQQHLSLSHLVKGLYVMQLHGNHSSRNSIKFILR